MAYDKCCFFFVVVFFVAWRIQKRSSIALRRALGLEVSTCVHIGVEPLIFFKLLQFELEQATKLLRRASILLEKVVVVVKHIVVFHHHLINLVCQLLLHYF
eukprot:GEMP01034112.1.p1 GENE.GEMP01034112.1~~GEMP01034112.1.p1  ORF type:complete len:101 (-),score=12.82 GEMP01034112.1:21-323(-)